MPPLVRPLRRGRLPSRTVAARLGESLRCSAVHCFDDDALLQVTTAVEVPGRQVDALRVAVAGEVADRSRSEFGTGQLSAKKGCRNTGELLERITQRVPGGQAPTIVGTPPRSPRVCGSRT